MVELDTALLVVAFVMGMAPAVAYTWLVLGKTALEMFQTADTQALTEKANPNLVTK